MKKKQWPIHTDKHPSLLLPPIVFTLRWCCVVQCLKLHATVGALPRTVRAPLGLGVGIAVGAAGVPSFSLCFSVLVSLHLS